MRTDTQRRDVGGPYSPGCILFGEFARSIVNANAGLFFRVVWITRLGESVGSHDTIGESGECTRLGESDGSHE